MEAVPPHILTTMSSIVINYIIYLKASEVLACPLLPLRNRHNTNLYPTLEKVLCGRIIQCLVTVQCLNALWLLLCQFLAINISLCKIHSFQIDYMYLQCPCQLFIWTLLHTSVLQVQLHRPATVPGRARELYANLQCY